MPGAAICPVGSLRLAVQVEEAKGWPGHRMDWADNRLRVVLPWVVGKKGRLAG